MNFRQRVAFSDGTLPFKKTAEPTTAPQKDSITVTISKAASTHPAIPTIKQRKWGNPGIKP